MVPWCSGLAYVPVKDEIAGSNPVGTARLIHRRAVGELQCMNSQNVTLDIYVWKSPRDVDEDRAEVLVKSWHADDGDHSASPFEPSTDVGWFYREVINDLPGIEASSDIEPHRSTKPVWLSANDQEPPARVVGMRLSPGMTRDELEAVFGLAAKYDLVVFDTRSRRVHLPLAAMAAHASATFWPAGAIQAVVAGIIGGAIAVAAWFLGIPVVSGLLMLAGAFMFVMAVYTFIHEGRKAARAGSSMSDRKSE